MIYKLIVLIGRRWFDKRAGNTYHDTEIIVHGFHGFNGMYATELGCSGHHIEALLQHRTIMQYGYGDHYIQTGADWLEAQGIISCKVHANGSKQPLWQYCQDNGIKLITSCVDVINRKELKQE